LWLLVDDLRPELGAYGSAIAKTPRLDMLADESVVFDRAYCQLTVCAPSRNSFMSGRRPDSLRVYNFMDHFRATTPDAVPLPEFFKARGYVTLGAGKTYQPGKPPEYDAPRSWSDEMPYLALQKNLTRCAARHLASNKFLDVCPEAGPDDAFMDRRTADFAEAAMRLAREKKKPFFVAAGFYRPHLRWHVPRRFYDRYEGAAIRTPAASRLAPTGMPDVAWANEGCHTMTTAAHGTRAVRKDSPLPEPMVAELWRGYLACVSWVDHLAGGVLDAADALAPRRDARPDTVVILSSDHGFHLGEQASWTKHTLFEHSARVPLAIRAPGVAPRRTAALTELTDVYRTLVDVAGLPAPAAAVQGASLAPLLHGGAAPRNFSVTQYPRCPRDFAKMWDANCKRLAAADIPVMGYSFRARNWRFTEWYRWVPDASAPVPPSGPPARRADVAAPPLATELYAMDDASTDSDSFELSNVAGSPVAACAEGELRAALALFLLCQHDGGAARRECDGRVSVRADAAADCVDAAAFAALLEASHPLPALPLPVLPLPVLLRLERRIEAS